MTAAKLTFFVGLAIGGLFLLATLVAIPANRRKACDYDTCVSIYPYKLCCTAAREESICCSHYGWNCDNVCHCTLAHVGHNPAAETCREKIWRVKRPGLVTALVAITTTIFVLSGVAGWTWWLMSSPRRQRAFRRLPGGEPMTPVSTSPRDRETFFDAGDIDSEDEGPNAVTVLHTVVAPGVLPPVTQPRKALPWKEMIL